MNDEIKEILEQLEIVVNKPLPMLILAPEYTKILLDYITNLQQKVEWYESIEENKTIDEFRLKINNMITNLQQENDYYFKKNNELSTLNTSLRNARDDYKSRVEKASEDIKDIFKDEKWYENYEYNDLENALKNVLNILKNGSEEKENIDN